MSLFDMFKKMDADDVVLNIIPLLDEVIALSYSAEKNAIEADSSMHRGIGAQTQHRNIEIMEAAEESHKNLTNLLIKIEKIDNIIKKRKINRENVEKEKKISDIISQVEEIIKEVKRLAKNTKSISNEAAKKSIPDFEATKYESHDGMGDNLIKSNPFISRQQQNKILKEQSQIESKAKNARKKAQGAREAREKVAENLKTIKIVTNPLKELKNDLELFNK